LFDLNSSDMMEIQRWLDKTVRKMVKQELNKMGVPRLLLTGVVQSVYKNGNNTYANVYLNGDPTISTNIPVNPDIAANVTANTPVWVMAVNFDQRDLYVLARKLA
jgi:hypothetical protein